MSDIEDQAAARVEKAKQINAEVLKRLHQNDVQAGVKSSTRAPRKAKADG